MKARNDKAQRPKSRAAANSPHFLQEGIASAVPPKQLFSDEETINKEEIFQNKEKNDADTGSDIPPYDPSNPNQENILTTLQRRHKETTKHEKPKQYQRFEPKNLTPRQFRKVTPFQLSKSKAYQRSVAQNQEPKDNALPSEVQAKMERTMGEDFSNVNIHKDSQSATDVSALAYAQGNDIHFAPGQFTPETQSGQELIGHELAHVKQQREGRVQATTQAKGLPVNDEEELEKEADDMGKKAATGDDNPAAQTIQGKFNATSIVQMLSKEPDNFPFNASVVNRSVPLNKNPEENGETIDFLPPGFVVKVLEGKTWMLVEAIIEGIPKKGYIKFDLLEEMGGLEVDADQLKTMADQLEYPVTPLGKQGRIGATKGDYDVLKTEGKKIYTKPNPIPENLETFAKPLYNEVVYVTGVLKNDKNWTHIQTSNGAGWVQSSYININETDPLAQLYFVKGGDNLSLVAQEHYKGKIKIEKGQDARLFVHAVAYVNEKEGRSSVNIDPENAVLSWKERVFLNDVEEESLKTFRSISIKSNHSIWLPNPDLILTLKDAGVISSGSIRAKIATVAEAALFYPGYQIGVYEGLWEGFKGIFTGIAALGKMIWEVGESIVKGELKAYLSKLWDSIKKGVSSIPASLQKAWDEFLEKPPFEQGRAVGKIVGMILLEVLIAYFTAGIGTAIKWVGNGGKFVRAFKAVDKVMDTAKKLPKDKLPTPSGKQMNAIGDAVESVGATARKTKAATTASKAGNWNKIKNIIGKPAGPKLPDGYSYYTRGKKRYIRRKTADNDKFAQIHIDKDGLTQPGPSKINNRLSKAATVTRNIGKAWKNHNRHHIIPDNVVRENPLFVAATKRGKPPYNLDNRANLEQLAKTADDKIPGLSDHLPTHKGSHPKYDAMVRKEAKSAIEGLEREFGSLKNVKPEILTETAIDLQDRVRINLENWPGALN